MKRNYKKVSTTKFRDHEHTAVLDFKFDGKTVKKGFDHVHIVKKGVVQATDDHTHMIKK